MASVEQQVVVVLSMVMTSLLMLSSGILADLPCNSSGCCNQSNYVQHQESRPLNLSQNPDGYDAKYEGEKAFIYHCVENFTSFLWFKVVNGIRIPYPWEEEGRVLLPEDRHNQTILIQPLKLSDGAMYTYVASNGTHNVTGTFELQVDCRGSAFSFATSEQPVQAVKMGSQKTLRCAANKPRCPQPFRQPRLFWEWKNESSSSGRTRFTFLRNNTLPHTSVVCESNHENCTVYISRVERIHFEGEFICRFMGESYGPPLNETVKFVQIDENPTTLWPVVGGVVASLVVLIVVVVPVTLRYGHRLRFWCRRLPDRGECKHDAVIVHGEDHEELAHNHLKPGLQQLGYDVMDEVATPGRPEVLEQADAILNSYCVVLTFSDRELQEASTQFLTQVTQLKAHRGVLFVRCDVTPHADRNDVRNHAACSGSSDRQNGAADGSVSRDLENASGEVTSHSAMEEGRLLNGRTEVQTENANAIGDRRPRNGVEAVPDNRAKSPRDVWKDERLKVFKVLRWPQGVQPASKTSRELDKFWYNLRSHLPKPAPTQDRVPSSARSGGHRHRQDCESASSRQGLLSPGSTDRTLSQTSDCTSPTRGSHRVPSAEYEAASRSTPEGQRSGFDPNPQLNCLAKPSAALSENPDETDDVFIDATTVHARPGDVSLSVPGPSGISHDFVQSGGLPHGQKRRGCSNELVNQDLQGIGEDLPAAVHHYRQSAPDALSPRVQATHLDSSLVQLPAQNLPTKPEAEQFGSAGTSKAGSSVSPRQISAQSVPTKLPAQSFPSLEPVPSPMQAFSQPVPFHSNRTEVPVPPNSAFPSSLSPPPNTAMMYPLHHNNGVASGSASGSAMDARVADSSIHAASSLAASTDLGNGRSTSGESSFSKNFTGQTTGDVTRRRETDYDNSREPSGLKAPYHTQESGYHSISPSNDQNSPRFN